MATFSKIHFTICLGAALFCAPAEAAMMDTRQSSTKAKAPVNLADLYDEAKNSFNFSRYPLLATVITLEFIGTNFPMLTSLNIAGCNNVSDGCLYEFAKRCKYLKEINLSHCSKITDMGIMLLARHCPALTSVNLHHCTKITSRGIGALLEQHPLIIIHYGADQTEVNNLQHIQENAAAMDLTENPEVNNSQNIQGNAAAMDLAENMSCCTARTEVLESEENDAV